MRPTSGISTRSPMINNLLLSISTGNAFLLLRLHTQCLQGDLGAKPHERDTGPSTGNLPTNPADGPVTPPPIRVTSDATPRPASLTVSNQRSWPRERENEPSSSAPAEFSSNVSSAPSSGGPRARHPSTPGVALIAGATPSERASRWRAEARGAVDRLSSRRCAASRASTRHP
jgi:hypothetical protein